MQRADEDLICPGLGSTLTGSERPRVMKLSGIYQIKVIIMDKNVIDIFKGRVEGCKNYTFFG
jgi:hypothetical protein